MFQMSAVIFHISKVQYWENIQGQKKIPTDSCTARNGRIKMFCQKLTPLQKVDRVGPIDKRPSND